MVAGDHRDGLDESKRLKRPGGPGTEVTESSGFYRAFDRVVYPWVQPVDTLLRTVTVLFWNCTTLSPSLLFCTIKLDQALHRRETEDA